MRWGLYESAKKFVGWPITPGFEFSGVVVGSGANSKLKNGDKVFGVTMFGGYSNKITVPHYQLFKIPAHTLSMQEAAGFPSVALTAWMAAVELARPRKSSFALVHSAAGGVGSMLCMILRNVQGCKVVGVVGAPHKRDLCSQYCDHVIVKSQQDLWKEAERFSPSGYDVIFDANGISTFQQSYDHLAPLGKLVVYGFHSLLPRNGGRLGVFEMIKLAYNWLRSPTFDPFLMVPQNRSVLAFNLSFLFGKVEILEEAMSDLLTWVKEGKIRVSKVTTFDLENTKEAHMAIESGMTCGKLVLKM